MNTFSYWACVQCFVKVLWRAENVLVPVPKLYCSNIKTYSVWVTYIEELHRGAWNRCSWFRVTVIFRLYRTIQLNHWPSVERMCGNKTFFYITQLHFVPKKLNTFSYHNKRFGSDCNTQISALSVWIQWNSEEISPAITVCECGRVQRSATRNGY